MFQERHTEIIETDTERGRFHKAITAKAIARTRPLNPGGFWTCDPLAMLVAVDDSVILESSTKFCTVELRGDHTRGMLCVDWRNKLNREPNVQIVTKVNMDKFYERFKAMVTAPTT